MLPFVAADAMAILPIKSPLSWDLGRKLQDRAGFALVLILPPQSFGFA
jgi:hypothetical protein